MRNSLIPASFAVSWRDRVAVAGAEDDGDVGSYLEKLLGELKPGDSRHGLIGNDEIEMGRIRGKGL